MACGHSGRLCVFVLGCVFVVRPFHVHLGRE